LFETTRGGVLDFFNMFSGGSLERMSLIALGVMPYITASIVVQLATSMSPTLAALKKEGETGARRSINIRVTARSCCARSRAISLRSAWRAGALAPASRQ
jgi:preprotein translocase subunit SecY